MDAMLTSILRSIDGDCSIIDPIVNVDFIIYKVGNSKINGVKIDIKTAKLKIKDKSKDKNLVKSFLVNSQVLIQDSRSNFLTS